MNGTFHLPDGQRVRTRSTKRYVLFTEWHTGHTPRYRTDDIDRARLKAHHCQGSRPVIVDTHTGKIESSLL